ncbi:MAG TPA: glycosyltransferase family 4 protein [Telluria sp.]|nr:glycosyltransferase family 4 protein [Telluria sp.]
MRILHLFDHSLPYRSGYALHSHALLDAQRTRGWNTVQLTGPAHGTAGSADAGGWHYYRTRAAPRWLHGWPFLSRAANLALLHARVQYLIRLARPHLVHAHAPALLGLAGLIAARRHGLPFVYEARDWRGKEARDRLEIQVARRADAVISPNAALLASLRRRGDGQLGSVMPGALEYLPSAQLRRRYTGPPRLLVVGPLAPSAGLDLLLSCMRELRSIFPGLSLRLADHGPLGGALPRQLERAGVQVDCLPLAEPEVLDQCYFNTDLALFLRQPGETDTGCYRLLEAMAHGCAVLATDIPGHRDQIFHGQTGILCDPGDRELLLQRLRTLLAEPATLRALGAAASAFVATQRTWDASMASYASIYARLLGRPL